MTHRAFTPDQERQLAKRYSNGGPVRTLAKEHGVSELTLRRALIRGGATLPSRPTKLDPVLDQVVELYRNGVVTPTIAQQFGVTPSTVQDALRRAGVELGGPGARQKYERIKSNEGYSLVLVERSDALMVEVAGNRKYVLEHRLVMARHLGRPLTSSETVHHKNGKRDDNRIENLELRVGRHGKGATEAHCPTCTCFAH